MLIGKKHFLTVGAMALAMAIAAPVAAQQKSVAVTAIVSTRRWTPCVTGCRTPSSKPATSRART